jgi:eukaryotic translation initiation factor 2C
MYADMMKGVEINILEPHKKVGNKVDMKPQLLFFVLGQKSTQPYNDTKAYWDIQLGITSQCKLSPSIFSSTTLTYIRLAVSSC